jgi:signal transduction histidine kinase
MTADLSHAPTRPTRPRSVSLLTAAGFVAAIVAGAVVGLGSYYSLRRLQQDIDARYGTHLTLMSLSRMLTHLTDAETGQRGYLITGDTAYLEPYHAALAGIGGDTVELRQAVSRAPTLALTLDRLGPLITARLALLDSAIRVRRAGDAVRLRAIFATGRGRSIMDSIRVEIAAESRAAAERRDARTALVRAGTRVTERVIFVSGVVTIILLGGAWFVIRRELAARARVERELRERERQLFQMLEAMPVGVFVADAAGHPYYANQTSRALLGKGIDAAGNDVGALPEVYQAYRVGTDTLYPGDEQPLARALAGQRSHATDIEIRRPDRVVPLEVWAAPVLDGAGQVRFAIAAFGDVSEREAARRDIEKLSLELEQQVEELQAANQEMESFSYSVSHDLRAPLRAIDGFSRILLEDHAAVLNEEMRRLLGVVRSNTQRMGRLIDDLLAFARTSRQEMRVAPVDMDALARAALDDLGLAGGGGHARVTVAELPPARGDATLLRQVWANLIGNAVKYSRGAAEPRVTIEGDAVDGVVQYRVRDNGVGFDMAYAGKLFGVFQRLHRTEEFEGTGVGLATVQRIVQRHGGRVWAESRVGEGATFFFTLPVGG